MAGMPITATWDQDSFAWYTDAGGEGTNQIGSTNSNPTTLGSGTNYRLRYLIQETNGSNQSETPVFELEYRVDATGGTSFGSWLPIDSDDTYFTAVASASVTDGGTTTQQIGAGTFNDGEFSYVDATARASTNAMAATAGNDEYECEWVLNFASAAQGANFEFRVTRDTGTTLDTYTNTTQTAPVDTTDDLLANDVESASEVSSPAIGQEHAILANDVESASEVSSPAVGQEHALTANDVESATEVSAPALSESHALSANDVESASEVTAPSIGQEHAILADDVESASEVSQPPLGQTHALLANDVESASEVTSPTLAEASGTDNLLADDVESASEVSSPALGQEHALNATSVESASEVTAPSVGQEHALTATSVESASEVSTPVLAESSITDSLLAEDVESSSEVSSPALGQVHALLANSVESSSSVDSPALDGEEEEAPRTAAAYESLKERQYAAAMKEDEEFFEVLKVMFGLAA